MGDCERVMPGLFVIFMRSNWIALNSLPDTFLCKGLMEEKRTYLGQGGEEQKTRSSH
jgi:hypothetical protein